MRKSITPPVEGNTAQAINARGELPIVVRYGERGSVDNHRFDGRSSEPATLSPQPGEHAGLIRKRKPSMILWIIVGIFLFSFANELRPLFSHLGQSLDQAGQKASGYAALYKVRAVSLERGITSRDGITSWLVRGTVVNATTTQQNGPNLHVKLIVKHDGRMVASDYINLTHQPLPEGASLRFSAWLKVAEGVDVEPVVVAVKPALLSREH
jgi:hypothetical protein